MGEDCQFEPGTESFRRTAFGGNVQVDMVKGRIRCADGVILRGDTIRYYDARGFAELIGDVFYADSTRTMTAVTATYYRENRQLIANGDPDTDVVVTDQTDGARLSGINLIYYQAGGGRAEDEVTVFGRRGDARPRALLPVQDSGEPGEEETEEQGPLDVTADRILLRGENYFEAFGRVDTFRDSVTTYSDTLVYDQVISTLDLRGNARLVQVRDTIEGRRVLVRLPENQIREIESSGDGILVSGDLRLESPWFRVTFEEGDVDGLWAAPLRRLDTSEEPDSLLLEVEEEVPDEAPVDLMQALRDSLDAAQPYAVSGETRIRADSLDVASNAGRLEQVVGIGNAYAVSARDSTLDVSALPEVAKEDWMRGDTIVASFASRVEGDSTVYEIDRIIASGNASSLYRLAPDSAAAPPDAPEADSLETVVAEPDAPLVPPADSLGVGAPPADSVGLATEGTLVVLPSSAPGVHYVVAARIILVFEEDEVSRMEVLGLEEGVHLEPRRGAGTPAATPPPGGMRDE